MSETGLLLRDVEVDGRRTDVRTDVHTDVHTVGGHVVEIGHRLAARGERVVDGEGGLMHSLRQ